MRINKKNDLGPSKGLVKYVHKAVMFILLPFRKPAVIIPVLILAYLIPTFIGAKPAEVHLWYYSKIKGVFLIVKDKVEVTSKNIIPDSVKDFSKQTLESLKASTSEDNTAKIVETPGSDPQSIRRQMFEKAQSAPQSVDILAVKDTVQSDPETVAKAEPIVSTEAQRLTQTRETAKKLDLIYLVTPQEFNGTAVVTNANEITIDGNPIFLYGIYVDPNTSAGIEGKKFLQDLIDNSPVKCIAETYTKQGFATGLCFVHGKNINHEMVNQGISQNIALER